MSAKIRIENVTKIFPKQTEEGTITALENINLEIEEGEFVSLLGASGCGKSTLLRIMAGLEVPTLGQVWFNGEKVEGPSPKRGLVFQEHSLFAWLTVRQNIEFALKATKKYEGRAQVDQWLEMVGLKDFANNFPHQLSGGMRQRAALVRALAVSPEALMLDEPLGALDSFTRMNLQDELIRLWQERGNTMIMVTHDVDEAIYLSRRIVIMSPRPGRVAKILEVPMSYPRNRAQGDFTALRTQILKFMNFAQDLQEEYTI
ncbi:MAG TPA: ABC transporter ATP-binding protein [Clostridia bacterium]|nr:ABC transporter ATP-binding protein [Clostridia bacterium]